MKSSKSKKSESEQAAPVVSHIPVPPSDTALVVDLPDGQKLVIGKIDSGTVIEVATWRGTGRPDSRTNRLMLGVSTGEEQSGQDQSRPQPDNKNVSRWALVQSLVKKISFQFIKFSRLNFKKLLDGRILDKTSRFFNKTRDNFSNTKIIESQDKKPDKTAGDFDVEAILNEISK